MTIDFSFGATMVIVAVAVLSYILGVYVGSMPSRVRHRRFVLLRAMIAHRGELWTRTFDLRKRDGLDHFWIYPIMRMLEDDGLVESRQASAAEMQTEYGQARGMVPFRWYRLTERGAALVDTIEHGRGIYARGLD